MFLSLSTFIFLERFIGFGRSGRLLSRFFFIGGGAGEGGLIAATVSFGFSGIRGILNDPAFSLDG